MSLVILATMLTRGQLCGSDFLHFASKLSCNMFDLYA